MIYDVRHLTTYTFDAPVSSAQCMLRLTPMSLPDQHVLSHHIEVTPHAGSWIERTDYFGARSVFVTVEGPSQELRIDCRSCVNVIRSVTAKARVDRAWEDIRDEAFATSALIAASPIHYLFPSRAVPLSDLTTAYARKSFPAGRGILNGGIDLMHRIKTDFVYDAKATQVSTPLLEAFERRHGVCQDFAHVMIAGLRGLGLPAAYVSGYIHTRPPPGRPRLQGADATHAWVSLWCGADQGWIGLDPTNGILVESDHIVLSIGRDYADISPVDGVILGSGSQKLNVAVDVLPIDQRLDSKA